MANHLAITQDFQAAVGELQDIERNFPFRFKDLSTQMGTYAAHALDVIERQTGLNADLEAILSAIETHPDGRMRWMRINGRRENLIVFRDLSLLAYRKPQGTDDEEEMARLEVEAESLGRNREYAEDDMTHGLLPLVLTLDLGFHQEEPIGLILRPLVDQTKAGGESLKFVRREDGVESELVSPVSIQSLGGLLEAVLERVEESIELAWATVMDLPRISRPTSADMADMDVGIFEIDGLWSRGDEGFYWPPCLSRPVSVCEDTEAVSAVLKDLGDLALWACPSMPDAFTLTLLSAMTTDSFPSFSYTIPSQYGVFSAERRLAREVLEILQHDFEEKLELVGYGFPVGHRTGVSTPRSQGAVGLPIATIKLERPDAHRAFEIDQENSHSFDELPDWDDPDLAVAERNLFLQDPSALDFHMADQAGEVFTFGPEALPYLPIEEIDTYGMTVAGGAQANILKRSVSRAVCETLMDEYVCSPSGHQGAYEFSLIVGSDLDSQMRRPYGYVTVSGSFSMSPDEEQIGGQIEGRDITTYALDVWLDRLQMADVAKPVGRHVFLAAVMRALADMMVRLRLQAETQERHFEVDVLFGRSKDAWHDAPITDADLDFLQQGVAMLRDGIARGASSGFISIRDIDRSLEEIWAA